MNKYKDSFKKYEVKDEVKENIMRKIENHKRFKACYALLFVGILGIVSLTTVYAEQIKEFFKSWTVEKSVATVPEGASVDVIAQKTNFDAVKLEENNKHSEEMTVSQAEEEIGIDLLNYKDNKVGYTLSNFYNKDGLVSDIHVGYGILYQDKDISEFENITEGNNKIKRLGLHADIYTNNFEEDALLNDLWFTYVDGDNPYLDNYQKIELKNIGVTAVYYEIDTRDPEKDPKTDRFQSVGNELRFAYKGVAYTLGGQNMTLEEVISIANELSV